MGSRDLLHCNGQFPHPFNHLWFIPCWTYFLAMLDLNFSWWVQCYHSQANWRPRLHIFFIYVIFFQGIFPLKARDSTTRTRQGIDTCYGEARVTVCIHAAQLRDLRCNYRTALVSLRLKHSLYVLYEQTNDLSVTHTLTHKSIIWGVFDFFSWIMLEYF